MDTQDLNQLLELGFLAPIDAHFARLMARLAGSEDPALFLAAALVSHTTSEGNVCLDIPATAGQPLANGETSSHMVAPRRSQWIRTLQASGVVGTPGDVKPLILADQERLYLYRYWEYETRLVQDLQLRTRADSFDLNQKVLKKSLQHLFPNATDGTDWQKVAAFAAARKTFCVISGGPGTGKTSLITKILALILEQHPNPEVRIKLAAPTGKAAARLQDSIQQIKEKLAATKTLTDAILPEASTVHRLLGSLPHSPYFRHDRDNPLPADVVVVDEASMVDLALMSKLTHAMGPDARLILLGDKDQLASVEAGSVLGDICAADKIHAFSKTFVRHYQEATGERLESASGNGTGMQDCVIQLHKSYRFGSESGIGVLSRAVNQGRGETALHLLKSDRHRDIGWHGLPRPEGLPQALRTRILEGYAPFLRAGDPEEALQRFQEFRILCAVRRGPYGVHAINRLVEQFLKREGLLGSGKRNYRGRAVLITQNDYTLSLFNGDIGIMLPDPNAGGQTRAFFVSPNGRVRGVSQARLPDHETAFAMTVHKAQGSEFDGVVLMLPDQHVPVLTRELVYTGLTRAREQVEVWGAENVFLEAVRRRTQRASGLRRALWNTD
jgi:exodeoxyribonuclease V alpha subunit